MTAFGLLAVFCACLVVSIEISRARVELVKQLREIQNLLREKR